MIEVTLKGKTVKRSKNLRGILDYARKEPVVKVYVKPNKAWEPCALDCGAFVTFVFYDGAKSRVEFASASVAHDWILARRSWGKPLDKYIVLDAVVYDYLEIKSNEN